ncbi:MAG: tRNA dihydrouridine synthase DusB [Candidatus Omnitrophica bacterium]|jgi:tRNA-dihydrouridine synthase B|nr:tRNA dihydrouridine synthase DusB [Candidatus Omnitrophota bacterium]
MPLCIGKLKIPSRLILAPMAGVTDFPFRSLNRRFGCEFAFVEMINVRSLSHKSKKTKSMLFSDNKDSPLGVQILGCESEYILKGMEVLANYKYDLLDFNSACPAKKIVRRHEGSYLMRTPKKLAKLLKLVVKNSKVPVTVKIRSGWDKDSINAADVALACQDAGVSCVFMHGRSRMQEYSGNVDYKIIKQTKKVLQIPLVASGDIFDARLAKKMFDETGCDGLAVARGALGNPWLFNQIGKYLDKGILIDQPKVEEIKKVMREHLDGCVKFYNAKPAVIIFRKFFVWYTKGLRDIRKIRQDAMSITSLDKMQKIIDGLEE